MNSHPPSSPISSTSHQQCVDWLVITVSAACDIITVTGCEPITGRQDVTVHVTVLQTRLTSTFIQIQLFIFFFFLLRLAVVGL